MAEHHAAESPGRALVIGLGLTLGFAGVEALTGFLAGSLALVADAGHMLVDSSGLVLALVATLIARRPADLKRTYGYARAEVLVVPLQVLLMLGLAGYIVYEAFGRLGDAPEIAGWPVLAVGVVGLGVNLAVLQLLHTHQESTLNARGAALEVAFDAFGSVGVIVSAVVLITTGWTGVDVVVSLAIGALVVPRGIALLRHVISILLEAAPPGTNLEGIEADARSIPGVTALHDLHVWSLAPTFVALSAHVEVDSLDGCGPRIARLTQLLRERHGITHVTLQPETRELHEEIACCLYPDALADHEHAIPPRPGR